MKKYVLATVIAFGTLFGLQVQAAPVSPATAAVQSQVTAGTEKVWYRGYYGYRRHYYGYRRYYGYGYGYRYRPHYYGYRRYYGYRPYYGYRRYGYRPYYRHYGYYRGFRRW